MRMRFALLCFAGLSSVAYAGPSKVEVVAGQVVAHTIALTCLNGYVQESVLVRVESAKENPKFIRIDLSPRCDAAVGWIADAPATHPLRVRHKKECVLESSLDTANSNTSLPDWVSVKGADTTGLPFGKGLPCYESAEFPVVPTL